MATPATPKPGPKLLRSGLSNLTSVSLATAAPESNKKVAPATADDIIRNIERSQSVKITTGDTHQRSNNKTTTQEERLSAKLLGKCVLVLG